MSWCQTETLCAFCSKATSTLQSVCEQFLLSPGVFVHVNKMDQFFEGGHLALQSLKSHKIILYILPQYLGEGVCGLEGIVFCIMVLVLHTCFTTDMT